MSELELNILRAANGEIVRLPYDQSQRDATRRLKDAGLITCVYDDDQPTWVTTLKGRMLLSAPSPAGDGDGE